MSQFTFAILALLLLMGCESEVTKSAALTERKTADAQERTIALAVLQESKGVVYAVGEDEPYSGKVTSIRPFIGSTIEERYENGIKHGLYRSWYQNGQLEAEGNYVNGEIDGAVRAWHENGQLKLEATYLSGLENGLYREWSKDGQLLFEENYENVAPVATSNNAVTQDYKCFIDPWDLKPGNRINVIPSYGFFAVMHVGPDRKTFQSPPEPVQEIRDVRYDPETTMFLVSEGAFLIKTESSKNDLQEAIFAKTEYNEPGEFKKGTPYTCETVTIVSD